MNEPIYRRDSHHVVQEDAIPFTEWLMGREQAAQLLHKLADSLSRHNSIVYE
jgi:hypothetical protein